jgi:hypothetical protein
MTTLAELIEGVEEIVQDTSFTEASITAKLNRNLQKIAGGIEKETGVLTLPLPELFTTGTITTSTSLAYVAMPSDYQRDLVQLTDSDGVDIEIYDSFQNFLLDYAGLALAGDVVAATIKGRNLYYQGIPTVADTLTVYYHKTPATMLLADKATDEPEGLPAHLAYDLLVYSTARDIYLLIEDGIEGEGANTAKYNALFNGALARLEATIPIDGSSFFINGDERNTRFYIA